MYVSVEISCYPLSDDFTAPIDRFLRLIDESGLDREAGTMSTVLSGELAEVMAFLTTSMAGLMADHPAVFTLKISNACIARAP